MRISPSYQPIVYGTEPKHPIKQHVYLYGLFALRSGEKAPIKLTKFDIACYLPSFSYKQNLDQVEFQPLDLSKIYFLKAVNKAKILAPREIETIKELSEALPYFPLLLFLYLISYLGLLKI